ncbi:MAG: VWA domain-containing protein [Alphaproteobacteria bacterium]
MAENKPPALDGRPATPSRTSASADVSAFLKAAAAVAPPKAPGAKGRLLFALDATMSRQPTWDMACAIQAEMFREAAKIGSLDIQLVFFRGLGECRSSSFVSDPARLATLMGKITCQGGHTQIGRVLTHAEEEAARERVHALVFVGDAMEERLDDLCARAGVLALKGVPAFLFQEGHDPAAETAFREIARITKGAYARFSPGAAAELAELLKAVAIFAAGGRTALANHSGRGASLLLGQIK